MGAAVGIEGEMTAARSGYSFNSLILKISPSRSKIRSSHGPGKVGHDKPYASHPNTGLSSGLLNADICAWPQTVE